MEKMRTCKRLLWGMLTCFVMVVVLSLSAAAANVVRNDTTSTEYATLQTAIQAAEEKDVLVLTGDCRLSATIPTYKELTIDLNGHVLDLYGHNIWNGGKLTIIDSDAKSSVKSVHSFKRLGNTWYLLAELDEAERKVAVNLEDETATLAENGYASCVGGVILGGKGTKNSSESPSLGGAIINTVFDPAVYYEITEKKTGSLNIQDVLFLGCTAGNGGVIANEGGDVMLSRVRCMYCFADNGAFLFNNVDKTVELQNCRVKGCKVSGIGGAILNLGTVKATGLTISACDSLSQGGAICNGEMEFPNALMQLEDCMITECSAKDHGGAISSFGTLEMKDSSITSCSAEAGAGIFNYNQLMLKDSVIGSCFAGKYGGAIFTDGIITHGQDKAKATDTLTTLDGIRIENCMAIDHSGEGDSQNDHVWNESIYVRNSSLVMKSGYVENMIFTRDKSSYTNGGVTEEGYPACNVTITAGAFKNYVPKEEHLAGSSHLISLPDQNMNYVLNTTFNIQPTPKDSQSPWNEKKTLAWSAGVDVDTYRIDVYDDAKKEWKEFATTKETEGGVTIYDIAENVTVPVKKTYRVVAFKNREPVAVSDAFSISWEKPAEKKEDPQGGGDGGSEEQTKKPAALGTKLDVKAEDGGEYTVISGPEETPQVAYSLGSAAGKKKITIGGSVTAGEVTYTVTAIADNGLKNNKTVQTVEIKDSVTSIGQNAFSGCKGLTTIIIPASVKTFGAKMFAKCPKLKWIKFKSKKLKDQYFHKKTFKGLRTACVIKVPKAKVKTYQKMFRKKSLAKKVKVKKG